MPELDGAAMHEQFLYAVAEANGAFKAGSWARGRQRLARAMEEAGYLLSDLAPATDEALAVKPAHWLVVVGAAMEDGFSFHVVPEAGLAPELRAALEACDGVTFDSVQTLTEHPHRWRDCLLVMLAAGAREVGYFERQLAEAPPGLAPPRERLEALAGAWEPGWVDCDEGVIEASKLDTRIARVAYVFDWL